MPNTKPIPTERDPVHIGTEQASAPSSQDAADDASPRRAIRRIISSWMNPQYMKLHAGEMTAQEVRTVRAIVDCVGREIDALLIGQAT